MRKYLRFLMWVGGFFLLIGVILRFTLVEEWRIPDDLVLGASLAPSLNDGDTVLMQTTGELGFGDLVRCLDPDDPSEYVVGRVVGTSGDVVEVKRGILWLNNQRYHSISSCPEGDYWVTHPNTGAEVEINCDKVELAGGWHFVGTVPKSQTSDSRHEVSAGHFFLLSDNREFHDDSRDFGPVPVDTCDARIFFRLWSREGWSDEAQRMEWVH